MRGTQKLGNCGVVGFVFFVLFLRVSVADDYIAMYEPELENIQIGPYINNPRLFNIQTRCLLYDGPCDIIGQFLKPRMAKGLLGECILCTPKQAATLQELLAWVQTHRPDLYRLAIAKYLQNSGISLPPNELATLEKLEKEEGLGVTAWTTPAELS